MTTGVRSKLSRYKTDRDCDIILRTRPDKTKEKDMRQEPKPREKSTAQQTARETRQDL